MLARLVGHRLDAVALLGPSDDHGRMAGRLGGADQRPVNGCHVMAVDLDRLPAEGLGPAPVRIEVPAVHRLAGLAEAVHVDDGGKIVQPMEARVLEGLPHRALGHLRVAAQAPDAVREPVELLPGQGDADGDRQPLAKRSGRDVDPRQNGRRVAFDARAEATEGEHLVVADRARRLVHRVQQRRRVTLAEDEVVVAGVVRRAEVVAKVLRHEHGHQVGRRHRARRVPAPRRAAGSDRVDAELLTELAPLVVLGGHGLVLRKLSARWAWHTIIGPRSSTIVTAASHVADKRNGRPRRTARHRRHEWREG